jgi:prephenate dehydrogenase
VIQRLAIVGVGLLGGSVARAARAEGLAGEIVGVGRARARLEPALRDGTLDHAVVDLAAGVRDADFVVLAAPVAANERLLAALWPVASAGALVTDVGSTKRSITRAAERLGRGGGARFVGSHPMAGSERSGYAVSRPDLFRGATVVVTPTDATDPAAVKDVSAFWEALGARVTVLDPAAHDRAVAAVSHLPHLVADALVEAVARFAPNAFELAAGGFKDATRVAASDATIWQEIFRTNRDALTAAVGAFRLALADLEALIADDDPAALAAALARIAALRRDVG